MIGWRERAAAIHTAVEKRKACAAGASAPSSEAEAALAQQAAFVRRISQEVLVPVLKEFCEIVTGPPGKPVVHEYHKRAFGVTCELDSRRFCVNVFLLPDGEVRIAVSLMPSQTGGWHRDYRLGARNEEIEEWFGTALSRLYEVG
jgi:hypothetical protein